MNFSCFVLKILFETNHTYSSRVRITITNATGILSLCSGSEYFFSISSAFPSPRPWPYWVRSLIQFIIYWKYFRSFYWLNHHIRQVDAQTWGWKQIYVITTHFAVHWKQIYDIIFYWKYFRRLYWLRADGEIVISAW